jgi:hypothetical protein
MAYGAAAVPFGTIRRTLEAFSGRVQRTTDVETDSGVSRGADNSRRTGGDR